MEDIQQEVQRRVNDYLTAHPGKEVNLADTLNVSVPTVRRWKEGKNLPHARMANSVVNYLKGLSLEGDQ
jgi:hypothetical protein